MFSTFILWDVLQPPFFARVHARVWWKSYITIFKYFVIIILYCKMIHPVIFVSTRYIFYSIYFIIKYNIELIFVNTSIIEYWFFRMLKKFSPVSILLLLYLKKKITPRTFQQQKTTDLQHITKYFLIKTSLISSWSKLCHLQGWSLWL